MSPVSTHLMDDWLSAIRDAWRYRWYGLMLAWLLCLAGWMGVYLLPNRYDAMARIFVDTRTMLNPLMSGLAADSLLDQRIAVMGRTLMTRPNLLHVLHDSGMDAGMHGGSDVDDAVDRLAARIEFKSGGAENLYTLAYRDRDPKRARAVVQSLLDIFVESSLGAGRQDMANTRSFLDKEIQEYQERLTASEQALTEFKRRNLASLPGDKQDYFSRLEEVSSQLRQARLELREAEGARDAIRRRIAEAQAAASEPAAAPVAAEAVPPAPPADPALDARISALRENLDQLRMKYTEAHPDVASASRLLAQLEAQRARLAASPAAPARAADPSRSAASGEPRGRDRAALVEQLTVSLADAEAQVATQTARVSEYGGRYSDLRAKANQIPQFEAGLNQLERDYELNRAKFEKLLERGDSAQISEKMADESKTIDFRIVEPAHVSTRPSGPNRVLLVSLVLAGALAAGGGLALALSRLWPSFQSARSLRRISGRPVLGSVSLVETLPVRRVRQRQRLAFGLVGVSLLGSYLVVLGALLVLRGIVA